METKTSDKDNKYIYVYLWNYANSDAEELFARYGEEFDENRIIRINTCKSDVKRKELIFAGVMQKKVLDLFSVSPKDIKLAENGKPFLPDKSFYFNMSHSGSLIMFSIGNLELGCDIQKNVAPKEALIKRITSEEERKNQVFDFYSHFNRLWAIKESYVKMSGVGISKDMTEVSIEKSGDSFIVHDGLMKAYSVNVYGDDNYEAVVTACDTFDLKDVVWINN